MPKNKTPLIISVVGTSGSGKTTTIEYLTSHLTKLGFRVGVAKHIHREGFTIDTKRKDTWKHAKAGAKVVVGVSPNELAIIKKTVSETKFEKVTETLSSQQLDIALLEGFSTAIGKKAKLSKIVSAKNVRDLKYTLAKTLPPILAITGPVSGHNPRVQNVPAPTLDIPREGPILTSIVRRLLRPNELNEMLEKAASRHGGTCIGLAIGTRAAYLASCAFGNEPSRPTAITCGTKHCIAEAFNVLFPRSHVYLDKLRNDRITVRAGHGNLVIQLAPKRRFPSPTQVLKAPENQLFEYTRFVRMHHQAPQDA